MSTLLILVLVACLLTTSCISYSARISRVSRSGQELLVNSDPATTNPHSRLDKLLLLGSQEPYPRDGDFVTADRYRGYLQRHNLTQLGETNSYEDIGYSRNFKLDLNRVDPDAYRYYYLLPLEYSGSNYFLHGVEDVSRYVRQKSK